MKDYTHTRGLHKIIDGVAVRTDAAKIRVRDINYKIAGIPEILFDVSMDDLLERSAWKRSPSIVEETSKPRVFWIYADAMSDRMLCSWAYMVRKYIDDGLKARRISMKTLIDAQFDNEEKSHYAKELRDLHLVVIDITNMNNHKLLPTLLADVYSMRSRMKKTTIFLSDDDIGEMTGKYGQSLAKLFKNDKSIRRISSRNKRQA